MEPHTPPASPGMPEEPTMTIQFGKFGDVVLPAQKVGLPLSPDDINEGIPGVTSRADATISSSKPPQAQVASPPSTEPSPPGRSRAMSNPSSSPASTPMHARGQEQPVVAGLHAEDLATPTDMKPTWTVQDSAMFDQVGTTRLAMELQPQPEPEPDSTSEAEEAAGVGSALPMSGERAQRPTVQAGAPGDMSPDEPIPLGETQWQCHSHGKWSKKTVAASLLSTQDDAAAYGEGRERERSEAHVAEAEAEYSAPSSPRSSVVDSSLMDGQVVVSEAEQGNQLNTCSAKILDPLQHSRNRADKVFFAKDESAGQAAAAKHAKHRSKSGAVKIQDEQQGSAFVNIHTVAAGVQKQLGAAIEPLGDCVFLFGGTGVGKSTTANWLVGKKIVDKELTVTTKTGRTYTRTVLATPDDSECLPGSEIGHTQDSQTCLISAHLIDSSKLTICDCVGFSDTAGTNIDVINAISILTAVGNCNSAKLVLVVDGSSIGVGAREGAGKALVDHLRMLNRFLPPADVGSVLILFSHMKDRSVGELEGCLEQLQDANYVQREPALQRLVRHCISLLSAHQDKLLLHPSKNAPHDVLAILEGMKPIATESLGTPLDQKTQSTIEAECRAAHQRVGTLLRSGGRLDTCSLRQDMQALQILSRALSDVGAIEQSYKQSSACILEEVNDIFRNAQDALQRVDLEPVMKAINDLNRYDRVENAAAAVIQKWTLQRSVCLQRRTAQAARKDAKKAAARRNDLRDELHKLTTRAREKRAKSAGVTDCQLDAADTDNQVDYTSAVVELIVQKELPAVDNMNDNADNQLDHLRELNAKLVKLLGSVATNAPLCAVSQYVLGCAEHETSELVDAINDQAAHYAKTLCEAPGQDVLCTLDRLRDFQLHCSSLLQGANTNCYECGVARYTQKVETTDQHARDVFARLVGISEQTEETDALFRQLSNDVLWLRHVSKEQKGYDHYTALEDFVERTVSNVHACAREALTVLTGSTSVTISRDMEAEISRQLLLVRLTKQYLSDYPVLQTYAEACKQQLAVTTEHFLKRAQTHAERYAYAEVAAAVQMLESLQRLRCSFESTDMVTVRIESLKSAVSAGLVRLMDDLSSIVHTPAGPVEISTDNLHPVMLLGRECDVSAKLDYLHSAIDNLASVISPDAMALARKHYSATCVLLDEMVANLCEPVEATEELPAVSVVTACRLVDRMYCYLRGHISPDLPRGGVDAQRTKLWATVNQQIRAAAHLCITHSATELSTPDQVISLKEQIERLQDFDLSLRDCTTGDQQTSDAVGDTCSTEPHAKFNSTGVTLMFQPPPIPGTDITGDAFGQLLATVEAALAKSSHNLRSRCADLRNAGSKGLADDATRRTAATFQHPKIELDSLTQYLVLDKFVDGVFKEAHDALLNEVKVVLQDNVDLFSASITCKDIAGCEKARATVEQMASLSVYIEYIDNESERMSRELTETFQLFRSTAIDLYRQHKFEDLAQLLKGMKGASGVDQRQDEIKARDEIFTMLEKVHGRVNEKMVLLEDRSVGSSRLSASKHLLNGIRTDMQLLNSCQSLEDFFPQVGEWRANFNEQYIQMCSSLYHAGSAHLRKWSLAEAWDCRQQLYAYSALPLHSLGHEIETLPDLNVPDDDHTLGGCLSSDIASTEDDPICDPIPEEPENDQAYSRSQFAEKLRIQIDQDKRLKGTPEHRHVSDKWINDLFDEFVADGSGVIKEHTLCEVIAMLPRRLAERHSVVIIQGALSKRPSKKWQATAKGWKEKWFVLTGSHLCYYDNEADRDAGKPHKKSIPTQMLLKLRAVDEAVSGVQHAFEILIEDRPSLKLHAPTSDDPRRFNEWCAAFAQVIGPQIMLPSATAPTVGSFEKELLEYVQHEQNQGEDDKAMQQGTVVTVADYGNGVYVSFHRSTFGANKHTIKFACGEKTITLREHDWEVDATVNARENTRFCDRWLKERQKCADERKANIGETQSFSMPEDGATCESAASVLPNKHLCLQGGVFEVEPACWDNSAMQGVRGRNYIPSDSDGRAKAATQSARAMPAPPPTKVAPQPQMQSVWSGQKLPRTAAIEGHDVAMAVPVAGCAPGPPLVSGVAEGTDELVSESSTHPVALMIGRLTGQYRQIVSNMPAYLKSYIQKGDHANIDRLRIGLQAAEASGTPGVDGLLSTCERILQEYLVRRYEETQADILKGDIEKATLRVRSFSKLQRSEAVQSVIDAHEMQSQLQEQLQHEQQAAFRQLMSRDPTEKTQRVLRGTRISNPLGFERHKLYFLEKVSTKVEQWRAELAALTLEHQRPSQRVIQNGKALMIDIKKYHDTFEDTSTGEAVPELRQHLQDLASQLVDFMHTVQHRALQAHQCKDQQLSTSMCDLMKHIAAAIADVLEEPTMLDLLADRGVQLEDCKQIAAEACKEIESDHSKVTQAADEALDRIMHVDIGGASFDPDLLRRDLSTLKKDGRMLSTGPDSATEAVEHVRRSIKKMGGDVSFCEDDRFAQISRALTVLHSIADIPEVAEVTTQMHTMLKESAAHDITRESQKIHQDLPKATKQRKLYNVNKGMEVLRSAEKHLQVHLPQVFADHGEQTVLNKIEDAVHVETQRSLELLKSKADPKSVAEALLKIDAVPSQLSSSKAKEFSRTAINEILDLSVKESKEQVTSETGEKKAKFNFAEVGKHLQGMGALGGEIMDRFPQFEAQRRAIFMAKTAKATPQFCIDELEKLNKFSAAEKRAVQACWGKYSERYEELIEKHFYTRNIEDLTVEVKRDALRDCVAGVAGIAAVWSLLSRRDGDDSMIKPHCVQILAIFRLLNEGSAAARRKVHESHLIQVRTGEGKSVLLGILATFLAITGNDVDCVCYSSYLSDRDRRLFQGVFEAFGADEAIDYGTFAKLAEKSINANGNVRSLTNSLLGHADGSPERAQSKRPKVLLIDEVDVFFSEEFYGETYDPITTFNSPEIETMQTYIWEHRADTGVLAAVKKLPVYDAVLAKHSTLKNLIDDHLSAMKRDADRVASDQLHKRYQLVPQLDGSQKIGYTDQDRVSTNIFINYETTFIYLKEQGLGKTMCMGAALGLRISCGHFSYAEMARKGGHSPYTHILGVTGTLDCLGSYEQDIIKREFGIKKQSLTPSIYGNTRLTFAPARDVKVEEQHEMYWRSIAHEIRQATSQGGAVIVFFESEEKLAAFQKSDHVDGIPEDSLHVVTTATDNIDHYVQQATRSGQATLFSRIHGRGLDFVCHDPTVEKSGGVHVVQTFLSVELSEEIQIKGRTARQDKSGSYKLVLLATDLADDGEGTGFCVTPSDIAEQPLEPHKTMYSFLDAKRRVWCDKRAEMRTGKVDDARADHQASVGYVQSLLKGNKKVALKYLASNSCTENAAAESVDVCFVMDATSSMGPHIQNAKTTITGIADQVKAKFPGVEVRFAFIAYRDHADQMGGHDRDHFEQFSFSEDVLALKKFIANVKPIGGGDAPEDVAGGLQKSLSLPWSASTRCCILVADAPCHGSKFHSCGGNYPDGDPNGLDPLAQMRQLRDCGIAFSFYSANSTTDQMGRMFADAYRGTSGGREFEMELKKLGDAAEFQAQAVGTIVKSITIGRL